MLFFMNLTHLILKKDICSIDDDVGELVETNAQEENTSKPMELEGPSIEDSEEMP